MLPASTAATRRRCSGSAGCIQTRWNESILAVRTSGRRRTTRWIANGQPRWTTGSAAGPLSQSGVSPHRLCGPRWRASLHRPPVRRDIVPLMEPPSEDIDRPSDRTRLRPQFVSSLALVAFAILAVGVFAAAWADPVGTWIGDNGDPKLF